MSKLLDRPIRRTTLVAAFCAAVLVGTGLARIVHFESTLCVASLLLMVAIWRFGSVAVLLAAILAGLCLGGWRGTEYMSRLAEYQQFYGQKVTVVGIAGSDAVYNQQKQLAFDISDVYVADAAHTPLVGKIAISGFGENVIFRGDTVQVTGKLKTTLGSKQARLTYAQFKALERDHSPIEEIRQRFGAGMLSALPEPMASFGMGILIGQSTTLPKETHDDLLKVGLVHIIAVSGYNLTIILRAGMRLFGKRSKYQTMLFSVTLIGVFLLLTGASPSIVRASLVSGMSIAAWYYGRAFKPLTLILLAAAITVVANPLYVWGDIGWYLSFLAFYGVLILSPQIRHRFVPERLRENAIFGIALESICAEIMTLPLILYIFGQMSHISLVANVVIAAFVPVAMLLTVLAGLAGTFLFPVAGWVAWPATLILTYMLDVAHLLASIPNIFVQGLGFSLGMMAAAYACVLLFNLVMHSRLRRNRAIILALHEEHTLLQPAFKSMGRAVKTS
jgi:competence protein ComEC